MPETFFTSEELQALVDGTKPKWLPASEFFDKYESSTGRVGKEGYYVEEPLTGTRLRRLSNGGFSDASRFLSYPLMKRKIWLSYSRSGLCAFLYSVNKR